MKIYIDPNPLRCVGKSGGVNAVITSQASHLQARGHEIVTNSKVADITIGHALASTLQYYDIAYTHGVYPTRDYEWPKNYEKINFPIFKNIVRAKRVVCCSEWTADILKWYFRITPEVIPNGIELSNYNPAGNSYGSILWGKTSTNPVCNPYFFIELAKTMPNKKFVSMCKLPVFLENITCFEGSSPDEYNSILKHCSIYLGTTKENSPIGQMEALAYGIPIVGFEHGWNKETLYNSPGALLVPPNNMERLETAVNFVLKHWNSFHEGALETAKEFSVEKSIDKLETLCFEVLKEKSIKNKVSIVIPNHNYSKFVDKAIESALSQKDAEVIVVDDCSTDNSSEVIKKYADKIIFIQNKKNIGVSETRNKGIFRASGNLIVCLDADDELKPNFCEILSKQFIHKGVAVAYAPIELMSEDGTSYKKNWFEEPFDFKKHVSGLNQVPSCAMFRKEYWLRAEKYKKEFEYCEDAEFWMSIAKVSGEFVFVAGTPLMRYRLHDNQKTKGKHNTLWKEKVGRVNDNIHSSFQVSENSEKVITFRLFYTSESIYALERTIHSITQLPRQNWIVLIEGNINLLPKYLFEEYPFIEVKRSYKTLNTSIFSIKIGDDVSEEFSSECLSNFELLWSEL